MDNGYEDRAVWVGCLAARNSSMLHGEWLQLDDYTEEDEFSEAVAQILKRSPVVGAEETYIGDTEGFGSCAPTDVSGVWELHEYYTDCAREFVPFVVAEYCRANRHSESGRDITDHSHFTHANSLADYAAEYADNCGVPTNQAGWIEIDWEASGRNLTQGMAVIEDPTGGAWYLS